MLRKWGARVLRVRSVSSVATSAPGSATDCAGFGISNAESGITAGGMPRGASGKAADGMPSAVSAGKTGGGSPLLLSGAAGCPPVGMLLVAATHGETDAAGIVDTAPISIDESPPRCRRPLADAAIQKHRCRKGFSAAFVQFTAQKTGTSF